MQSLNSFVLNVKKNRPINVDNVTDLDCHGQVDIVGAGDHCHIGPGPLVRTVDGMAVPLRPEHTAPKHRDGEGMAQILSGAHYSPMARNTHKRCGGYYPKSMSNDGD